MRCAVCDLATGSVTNTIVADPDTDQAPQGTQLVAIGSTPVDSNWVYHSDGSFSYTLTAQDIAASVAAEASELKTDPEG